VGAAFSKHQAALLSTLTDYAAIAIQNARAMDQLRQTKENEKGRIRSLFQRFVPPQVVDQILENPELLQLGGNRRDITILFTDIRGYTSYSENLPPEKVVEMLNDYLSLAANTIMSYGGTLDKYMGDGLMAIFNAPDEQPDHLRSALESALTLQQGAKQLAAQRGDGLSFSIGIHFGEAVVGYIGTDCAMNYTAVGDVVNLAKRLQEAARPGQIIIEESIAAMLNGKLQTQSLGELKIKGRQRPAAVFELLGMER
jgi:adenylate cyclase